MLIALVFHIEMLYLMRLCEMAQTELEVRWFGCVHRRDGGLELPEEKTKTTEKIHGCSEGHAEGWCDRGGCRDRNRCWQMIRCGDP